MGDLYGPTQVEYDAKPEVDITGNLSRIKVQNAVRVISVIASKYVGTLKWDFILIEREGLTLEPYIVEGFPTDIAEGICGMISLGAAVALVVATGSIIRSVLTMR